MFTVVNFSMRKLSFLPLLATLLISAACGTSSETVSVIPGSNPSETALLGGRACLEIRSQLTLLTRDLLYPSECSDCGYTAVRFSGITSFPNPEEFADALVRRRFFRRGTELNVEYIRFETELNRLIRNLIAAGDLQGSAKLLALKKYMEASFSNLTVARVTEVNPEQTDVEIDIFFMGLDENCGFVGVTAKSVET
jgi:hypothetical protein